MFGMFGIYDILSQTHEDMTIPPKDDEDMTTYMNDEEATLISVIW